jgi:hypothetical protein
MIEGTIELFLLYAILTYCRRCVLLIVIVGIVVVDCRCWYCGCGFFYDFWLFMVSGIYDWNQWLLKVLILSFNQVDLKRFRFYWIFNERISIVCIA